jgi:hypothetical protein
MWFNPFNAQYISPSCLIEHDGLVSDEAHLNMRLCVGVFITFHGSKQECFVTWQYDVRMEDPGSISAEVTRNVPLEPNTESHFLTLSP